MHQGAYCINFSDGDSHPYSQYLRLAELDEVLVGGPRWQASDIQVGLTQLLCPSLAATVGAGAGRSHGMRGWSIGLLGKERERKDLTKS